MSQSDVLTQARRLIEEGKVPNLLAALSVLSEQGPAARAVAERLLRLGPKQLRQQYPWGFPARKR
jgi:hypothetical protein